MILDHRDACASGPLFFYADFVHWRTFKNSQKRQTTTNNWRAAQRRCGFPLAAGATRVAVLTRGGEVVMIAFTLTSVWRHGHSLAERRRWSVFV